MGDFEGKFGNSALLLLHLFFPNLQHHPSEPPPQQPKPAQSTPRLRAQKPLLRGGGAGRRIAGVGELRVELGDGGKRGGEGRVSSLLLLLGVTKSSWGPWGVRVVRNDDDGDGWCLSAVLLPLTFVICGLARGGGLGLPLALLDGGAWRRTVRSRDLVVGCRQVAGDPRRTPRLRVGLLRPARP